jgi:hypothetical protein
VLAILCAKEAEADPDVVAFRKEVLRGRLLQVEDVEGWLEEHAKADGPGKSERGSQIQVLAYAIPADRWERCIPTAASRVLERLRQIVERLSERYRWQEAQATIFVLTGRTPLVPPAEAKIEREAIVLTVDPSLTPRQVANYYRQFKKEILGGGRIKALSLAPSVGSLRCKPSERGAVAKMGSDGTGACPKNGATKMAVTSSATVFRPRGVYWPRCLRLRDVSLRYVENQRVSRSRRQDQRKQKEREK